MGTLTLGERHLQSNESGLGAAVVIVSPRSTCVSLGAAARPPDLPYTSALEKSPSGSCGSVQKGGAAAGTTAWFAYSQTSLALDMAPRSVSWRPGALCEHSGKLSADGRLRKDPGRRPCSAAAG